MGDILFIGSAAAVAFFLLQNNPSKVDVNGGEESEEVVDRTGTVKPPTDGEHTTLDTNVLDALQQGFSNSDTSAIYDQYINTEEGRRFHEWRNEIGGTNETIYEDFQAFLKKTHGSNSRRQVPSYVNDTTQNIHKRNQTRALSNVQNAYQPFNAGSQWRARPNTNPLVGSFLTPTAKLTKSPTAIDKSPYTLHGLAPFDLAGGRVNDGQAWKSRDNKEFVNLTAHAAEYPTPAYIRNDFPKPIHVARDQIRVYAPKVR